MLESINKKIKKLRKKKKMTLVELGNLTDFTKGYLSRIENSAVSPRLPTLQKIARALEVDVGYFFEEPFKDKEENSGGNHNLDLTRGQSNHHSIMIESDSAYSYHPLVHSFSGKYMAPYLLRVEKGKTERFTHDSEEMLYVVRGKVRFLYNGKEHVMASGDCAYLDSRLEHQVFNDEDETAVLLNVVYDYKRF